jgi:hypothetical protein
MKFVDQLLSAHLARYPAMQLDDIYKLLHQAALGPGHAVDNPVAARKRLDQEIEALGKGSAEPMQDIISPDGRLGRVHLRSYLAAGGDADALHRAFVETANSYPPSPDKLAKFCGCLGDLAAADGIPFAREEVLAYFGKIAQAGYPAVHHSEAFRNAYQPAYRVVAIDLLLPVLRS